MNLSLLQSRQQAERTRQPSDYSPRPPLIPDEFPISLKLETRGTTSQIEQQTMWEGRHIHKTSIAAKLRASGNYELADKLDSCGSHKTYCRCTECGKTNIYFNRCDLLICPTCQPRLTRRRHESISWWTERFYQPKHVVLTIRNQDRLTKDHLANFKRNLTRLRRTTLATKTTTRKRQLRELVNLRKLRGARLHNHDLNVTSYPWLGGCWSLEITNEQRGWHLHVHLLVESRFIDTTRLAQTWAKITGQDFAIVKVKDARQKSYVRELVKYVVKPAQAAAWTPDQLSQFVSTVVDARTFGVFGELYKARAAHADWKTTLGKLRQSCECGCTRFRFYTQQEWDFYQIENEIRAGQPRPPPQLNRLPETPELNLS